MFTVLFCFVYISILLGWDSDGLAPSALRLVVGASLAAGALLVDGVVKTSPNPS